MNSQSSERKTSVHPSALLLLVFLLLTTVIGAFAQTAFAQTMGRVFSAQESELAELFDAAFIAQAKIFAEISAIGSSPATQAARDQFEQNLHMRENMSMAEMMAMMQMHASMTMPGPFDELESHFGTQMIIFLETRQSRSAVLDAYENSPLPRQVVEVLHRGRQFESRLYEILADPSVSDIPAALREEVANYLPADGSVPAKPIPADLLLEHPHAGAFARGYPKLSGFLWATQWVQLATIEALLLQAQEVQYWGSVDTVRARFQGKMQGSLLPVELPMTPAIAPTLFTLSPDAAVIIDNLNIFETVIADVLSYPNLENKDVATDALVAQFTNPDTSFASTMDYLLFALRGGIYNQGGPAIGELSQSERNRSRSEMGMQHAMIMSTQ
jgi:hypothetical protein